jgi:hypothetical protein
VEAVVGAMMLVQGVRRRGLLPPLRRRGAAHGVGHQGKLVPTGVIVTAVNMHDFALVWQKVYNPSGIAPILRNSAWCPAGPRAHLGRTRALPLHRAVMVLQLAASVPIVHAQSPLHRLEGRGADTDHRCVLTTEIC